MTVPIDDPEVIRRILADTDALLLDFDGPICSVFAGFPAPAVAAQLANILTESGHELPEHIAAATDPFDIFIYANTLGPDEARYVEAAFRAHEVEAIHTAQPTPGAHDLIHAWKHTGRKLAIVSNNSHTAVELYLNLFDLRQQVDYVAARTSADPSLLKPSPYLLCKATTDLSAKSEKCTLVGDSITDIQAARSLHLLAIGYANRKEKVERLSECQPKLIVTDIGFLLAPVSAR
jgi:phosphoglycolate phosphatase